MPNLTTTLNIKYNNKSITEKQIEILKLISENKSQNKVAKILNIPPSSVNIQIKRLEKKLGINLIYSSTSGTILTESAQNIVKYYESVQKRISKNPFIACGYISGELGKILFDDVVISSFDNIIKLHEMDLTSIIGIDDPYWSFRLGEPIPVAYDHFIMAYKKKFDVKNLIGIRYSSQRIIWNILKNQNIDFKITKVVKNPFYAIDLIEDGYSLFLNESFVKYLKKDYIIKKPHFYEKTKHTLNFIASNESYEKLINHVVSRKKKEIENRGFELVEYY